MKTEVRFVLAIGLMVGVMIVTNLLFPPVRPNPAVAPQDSTTAAVQPAPTPTLSSANPLPADSAAASDSLAATPNAAERQIVVQDSIYRHVFSTRGARLVSAELTRFKSFTREGPVQLIAGGTDGALGLALLIGSDTLDLHDAPFTPSREDVRVGSAPEALTFEHRQGDLVVSVTYTFQPNDYLIEVTGSVRGVDRALLLTDLGSGVALNDLDQTAETRALAYVANHLEDGITSYALAKEEQPLLREGPYLWAAFKSKFFVFALLPGAAGAGPEQFGGLLVRPEAPNQVSVTTTEAIGADGRFGYRAYVGPQEYGRLKALGNELDEVNPYGFRWMRPVIRPLVGIITDILAFLHDTFTLPYGWVLVLFGLLMRVVLWPLNQKAMRAQAKNMAVQPRIKDIQTRYKDKPEKMQEEMLKLYKETGFNPLAGCLPMLLPWPVLVALFFVFGNTIEFRGVPFLWLPDLSAPDPYFILPIFLAISMFGLMWIQQKFSPDPGNPQMKMMMFMMPVMMLFIFFRFAAGLNLYYSVSNLATIPQQYWIGKERMKTQPKAPVKRSG